MPSPLMTRMPASLSLQSASRTASLICRLRPLGKKPMSFPVCRVAPRPPSGDIRATTNLDRDFDNARALLKKQP